MDCRRLLSLSYRIRDLKDALRESGISWSSGCIVVIVSDLDGFLPLRVLDIVSITVFFPRNSCLKSVHFRICLQHVAV